MNRRHGLVGQGMGACILVCVSLAGAAGPGDRGHRLLLDRGLQIQAQTFPAENGGFDVTRWRASKFTTVNLQWSSVSTPFLGAAPGMPWGRWQDDGTTGLTSYEEPYLSNMVSIQIGDEQSVDDPSIGAALQAWRVNCPGVIGFTNQVGGVSAARLRSYMRSAQPDMLMFDVYPFSASLPGGSPTLLYGELEKYRRLGLAGNDGTGQTPIPCGLYLQTYWNGYHISESQMRLNQFSAWAFGFKFVSAFLYENSAGFQSVLFSGSGDGSPTASFSQIAETNRQSRHLGRFLVRLLSTGTWILRGYHNPGDERNDPPTDVPDWTAGSMPYLTNITAANPGASNDGLPGDVLVGTFRPLCSDFAGYPDEPYFMVVNGLTAPTVGGNPNTGLAATAQQNIRLTFDFGTSGITGLQRVNRDTGAVEAVALVHDSGAVYHLDLTLDGGTGDLFKFSDGVPFLASVVPSLYMADFNGTAAQDDWGFGLPYQGDWASTDTTGAGNPDETECLTLARGPNSPGSAQEILGGDQHLALPNGAIPVNGYGFQWSYEVKVSRVAVPSYAYPDLIVYVRYADGTYGYFELGYYPGSEWTTLKGVVRAAKKIAAIVGVQFGAEAVRGNDRIDVDNIILTPLPQTAIIGQVMLGGYQGDPRNVLIQVDLWQDDAVVRTDRVALDAEGRFRLDNVTCDTYRITIKGACWLEAVRENVTVSADPTDLGAIELAGADVDGDNRVSFADFSVLQNSYGQSGVSGLPPVSAAAAAPAEAACGPLGMVLLGLTGLGLLSLCSQGRLRP